MAIIKQAKNIVINCFNEEKIVIKGKLEEVTESKIVEATTDKLVLNCVKKIISNGNK